jgi:glyoxylase-like metal-dependent hydrolase (beta-lactamase superfamily II)
MHVRVIASEVAGAGVRAALVAALGLAGCSGTTPAGTRTDAPKAGDASQAAGGAAGGLVPGTLTVSWMHGSADCSQNTDPEVQVHAYNATTYIIRQNKCRTFEAPFVYLLIGTQSALSLDTGATDTPVLRDTIKGLIGGKPLLAAHSHAHGDHHASDDMFAGQPGVTLVANTVAGQQAAFGITTWPDTLGHHDLGDRMLDVVAIPGHEATHIAIYDRQTGLLLTGDSLYPGLLFISDWTTYRASMHRLARFAAAQPVAHVLGAHIEMTATPKVTYPYGTTFQPSEHALPLTVAHVLELDSALIQLGPNKPAQPIAHDDFIIDPT